MNKDTQPNYNELSPEDVDALNQWIDDQETEWEFIDPWYEGRTLATYQDRHGI